MARKPYDVIKRCGDILIAGVALVLASPIMAVTAALVARDLGRPVIFKQPRPGLHGQVFTLYKFRSMRDASPGQGVESDAERLSPFGRRLRSTSLDELPSLINVFKGDMSIVGPRPLLVSYLERYSPHHARRHEVRPGVTGLAQVSGRNAITWTERLDLDVEYVDRRSLALDLSIIARTVATVLRREGITSDGNATMEEFRGDRGDQT
ncbi:sugar transferase [Salinibacterium sp. dk2585]|uniref:sugar transferase n=1 Tax=unclassified Salinibacterium TaxID=2632331 RepID=UPI0011C24DCF|nr:MULTISPECIES: sugar transferase [unclassified Salinibacterium]QEE60845.1 sugar transferase [Salinibacterium sp. dk2585]TXK55917.1 sugar transferase [Salinibacterium sp. dk5596]